MTFDTGDADDLRAEINVTPLVDVMLVLLVIFMVVTPLLHLQLPIDLPQARTAAEPAVTNQVRLSMSADGKLQLNDQPVPFEQLDSSLRTLYGDRADKTLFLEADRALTYAAIVDVMDACRAAGVERIGLLTSRRAPE
jgi:biopolymer transport protein ExbD